ncbi:MAG: DUF6046 domain-containing protein [Tannerella sp.]|jgi:hypothetical protein|nr:DUF6046 domain-containing protein [Tannerella sp.]
MAFNTIFTKNDRITVRDASDLVQSGQPVAMVLPLSFRLPDGSWWLFPIEPLISVSGKNTVIRRNVAKSEKRGTIKERWAEDDLQINIQGALIHPDLHTYPTQDVTALTQAITQRTAVEVKNELLQLLNVHQIVVETYSLPFSKGENVQNYTIDAYSDDLYELFIEVKNEG